MAQGQALGKNDLFESDAFNDAIKGAETLLNVIKETQSAIKGSLTVQKEFVSTFKAKSFDDVKAFNIELKKTSDLIKMKQQLEVAELKVLQQQQTLEQASIKTMIEKNKLTQQQLKADQDLTKAIEAETKANQKAEQQLRQTNGEYKKGVQALAAVKQQLKELQFTGRDNGKLFKALSNEFKELDGRVRGAEASVGEFQRNVGNYNGQFNGLQNSINQITREMPAFANSVQTGFMAISNNLPIFFDAISGIKKANADLRAEGKPTQSLFSQLSSSIFSWGTALSVGVTLLTVYGAQFVKFIGDLWDGETALVAVNEALTENNKKLTELFTNRIDLELKLAVVQKKISQDDANRIKRGIDLRKSLRDEENNYYLQRIKIADELKIKLDKRGNPLIAGGESGDITTNVKQRAEQYYKEVEKLEASHLKIMNELRLQSSEEQKIADLEANEKNKKETKKANDDELKALEDFRKKREALMAKWAQIDRENEKETAKTRFKDLQGDIEELEKAWVEGYSRFEAAQKKAAKEFNISQDELMAEFFKSGIENFEEFLEYKRSLIEKDKKLTKDVINSVDKVVLNIDKIYKERYKRAEDYLDREIKLNETAIDTQRRLAERGLDNTLAFERKRAVQLQLQRQQLQEKEVKQQKRVAFYNLLSGYAKTEPATALQKAILETALAEVVAGNFIEGSDMVKDDLQGNKIHNGRDGYVIAVDGEEGILNPKQNRRKRNLGLSNDDLLDVAENAILGNQIFNYGNIAQPIINVPNQHIDLSKTENLLKEVKTAIENIPGNNWIIDPLGNLIHDRIKKGIKERTIYKNKI